MKIYKTMSNGVQIVEYDESMAQAIADMWNKSGDSWGGDNSIRTAEQISTDFSSGAYFNIFVAMYNNEAVGLCSFDRYYKDADTTYVHVLNVRPDYHGHKVGKELVLACVNRTIELIFLLFAISGNIKFYQVLCGVLGNLPLAIFSSFKRF